MTVDEVLAFEARTWRHTGAKDHAIRVTFGVSPVAYRVRLLEVLRDPAATRARPDVVRRLTGQSAYVTGT